MTRIALFLALSAPLFAGPRSTFEASDARNPFLPIGYVRPALVVPQEKHPDIRPDMFNVTAILLGDPSLAIINGKDRAVGDRIAIGSESVTVASIKDGQVTLRTTQGKAVIVGLRK